MINPIGMTVIDWTDSMAFLTPNDIVPMKLNDPSEWKDWARHLFESSTFSNQYLPNPDLFDDWSDWAERLFQTVELPG